MREFGGEFGSIKGRPITREQAFNARKEVMLFYFMNNRRWPTSEDVQDRQLQRETLYRVFMVEKLKELDIHVSEKAAGLFMSQLIGDTPREQFEREILAQANLRWDDFDRFVRHQVGIQQMLNVAGLSGRLINPKEAEEIYRQDSEELNVELAVFWSSNYLDKVTLTPDDIGKYYSNHLATYRVPERIQVSYVAFSGTNFFPDADKRMSEITNLDANISEFYFKRGTNQFTGADGKVLPEAEAKAKIKSDMRMELALTSARRKAAEFGSELMEQPDANNLGNFAKLAAAKGLPVEVSPPFDRMTGLDSTNFPPAFEEEAFKLTTNEPIRFRPTVGETAIYLIAYNKRIPFEFPTLDKVRDKVTADARLSAASDLARKAGTNFASSASNSLATGKSFADLAAQAKVPTLVLPPITEGTSSLTNIDERVRMQDLQRVIFDQKPGEASRFIMTRDGGWVAFLKSRTPASETKVKEELPKFVANMRYYRYIEAFNKWLGKQSEVGQLVPPAEPTNAPPPRAAAPAAKTTPPATKVTPVTKAPAATPAPKPVAAPPASK